MPGCLLGSRGGLVVVFPAGVSVSIAGGLALGGPGCRAAAGVVELLVVLAMDALPACRGGRR